MAKIKVELNASYGCNCMGCGYGSKETIEIEVNEQELEALRKLGSEGISCEAVVAAIKKGVTALQSFHEKLEEKFYYMVEEYWLYEGDNDCIEDSLIEYIEQDIADGLYIPESSKRKRGNKCGYDLDAYYDWVCSDDHDHAFIAERVGLDLYACREFEVNYKIMLSE